MMKVFALILALTLVTWAAPNEKLAPKCGSNGEKCPGKVLREN